MTTITRDNLNEFVVSGVWTISASVKEDKTSSESKRVNLQFTFDSVPIGEVIGASLRPKVINWQNGARDKFAAVIDGSTVKLNFTGGRQPIDPKANYGLWFASLSKDEQAAEIERLKAL